MNKSSLPYWDKRWGAHPSEFETSWPDAGCRMLELQYVKQVLSDLPKDRMILELGCGNFQLAEDPSIPELLKGRYMGLDGCAVAVKAAQDRNLPGLHFAQYDLTVPGLERFVDPATTFILTKRTIQNIEPAARKPLWSTLGRFRGGLLIEDFIPFRRRTDDHRYDMGRRPLDIPEFNWPIDLNENLNLLHGIQFYAFMGYYYQVTRCQGTVPDAIKVHALRLSQWAIAERRGQPAFGPVVALTYGDWKS